MTDLTVVAKTAIEEPFKDEVKARFTVLCSNLSGKASTDDECLGMFRNAMLILVKARTQALFIIDKVVL